MASRTNEDKYASEFAGLSTEALSRESKTDSAPFPGSSVVSVDTAGSFTRSLTRICSSLGTN